MGVVLADAGAAAANACAAVVKTSVAPLVYAISRVHEARDRLGPLGAGRGAARAAGGRLRQRRVRPRQPALVAQRRRVQVLGGEGVRAQPRVAHDARAQRERDAASRRRARSSASTSLPNASTWSARGRVGRDDQRAREPALVAVHRARRDHQPVAQVADRRRVLVADRLVDVVRRRDDPRPVQRRRGRRSALRPCSYRCIGPHDHVVQDRLRRRSSPSPRRARRARGRSPPGRAGAGCCAGRRSTSGRRDRPRTKRRSPSARGAAGTSMSGR